MLKRFLSYFLAAAAILSLGWWVYDRATITGAPPYDTSEEEVQLDETDPWTGYRDWKRPDGPPRVGLQAGHWKNDELPEELERLRGNTGSSGGGKSEWEVNLQIANLTAELLRGKGIAVDILPATVPERYWADAFVAIHADGNLSPAQSGFKIASPRRDYSGQSENLVQALYAAYAPATGLGQDGNISRNMRGYYAFSWRRFTHAIHPMTPAAIIETGFLTSPADRRVIVSTPQKSAQGISDGISNFLKQQELLGE